MGEGEEEGHGVGSLFSGLGGLDVALGAAGHGPVVWQVEKDPACQTVLRREWPTAKIHDDVTTLDWATLEPVDVLCGGYPCQPFSLAGARAGEDDERHLWPFYLNAIRVLRPRLAVLENVAGHLSLGFGRVLGDLAEIGYDVRWTCVRASDVGAPHRRERLFAVAHPSGGEVRQEQVGVPGSEYPVVAGRGEEVAPDPCGAGWERAALSHGGAVQALPEREPGDDAGGLGRAPQRTQDAADAASPGRGPLGPWERAAVRAIGAVEQSGRCGPVDAGVDWGDFGTAIRRWELAIGRTAPAPTDDRGRLSPAFVEWMMGFPEGWVGGLSRTAALRALGNAVVPQQGCAALGLLGAVRSLEGPTP